MPPRSVVPRCRVRPRWGLQRRRNPSPRWWQAPLRQQRPLQQSPGHRQVGQCDECRRCPDLPLQGRRPTRHKRPPTWPTVPSPMATGPPPGPRRGRCGSRSTARPHGEGARSRRRARVTGRLCELSGCPTPLAPRQPLQADIWRCRRRPRLSLQSRRGAQSGPRWLKAPPAAPTLQAGSWAADGLRSAVWSLAGLLPRSLRCRALRRRSAACRPRACFRSEGLRSAGLDPQLPLERARLVLYSRLILCSEHTRPVVLAHCLGG
mmetsp:Transcript_140210/g.355635  ORF Transcript_140210/g.355635 Transcript_140210/m.355635 type:complete len:263 (-) Transcript_140210:77-865(-)